MSETELVPLAIQSPQGLNHSIIDRLENYEDYLSFYIQLEESAAAVSWLKADTLHEMTKKLGDRSLYELSKELRQKHSTVINYVRVAKAFPMERREPAVSFSAHFYASFADSFSNKTQEFTGEKRFEWVKRVAEEGISLRELAKQIQGDKRLKIAETSEEEAWRYDARNKATELNKLLEGLMIGINEGNKEAYDKLVIIYDKVYAQNTSN